MKKTFMGVKLRTLRAERGLSQIALAHTLGLSPSYLNQLEQNQRPLTVSVLLKLHKALGVDVQQFSEDEESRLMAGLREALADAEEPVGLPELQEVAAQMPALGRAVLALHRRHLEAMERLEALSLQLGDDRSAASAPRAMAFEVVRDFFFAHQNYFDGLDRAAEALAGQARLQAPTQTPHQVALADWLTVRLQQQHGVRVVRTDVAGAGKRQFDPHTRQLQLSHTLDASQRAFQLGTQLALLECTQAIDDLIQVAPFTTDPASRKLARVGLANYFAGALLLPYQAFLSAAEALRYDIDLLDQQFGVGFETVCHRLSTLQRPDAPGVPFFFVRVDQAGNISKRQSATHFHFSRAGGDLSAVECVRGLCAARPRAGATGQHARWAALPVDCAHCLDPHGRVWLAAEDLLHWPGLRCAPRCALGVCQRPGSARPRGRRADWHGVQSVRARALRAARLPVRGPVAAGG